VTRTHLILVPAVSALALGGCVQLVAFEQPIVGQPDVVESPEPSAELLCDDEVEIGASALCDESCVIDPDAEGTRCGGRVTVADRQVTADVSGLDEVELTITVCGTSEPQPFVLMEGERGGGALAVDGRALAVGRSGEAAIYRHPTFLPDDDEECTHRTVFLQPGRLELADGGQRICSAELPAFEQPWAMRMHGGEDRGLRTLEVCMRRPR
jgi:hypothetical protein